MKVIKLVPVFLFVIAASCGTQKSYFTVDMRRALESKSLPLTGIQYYVDRDIELRTEVSSVDAKIKEGEIKFEDGKYVHVIVLKKNTAGVCTQTGDNKISVSFEDGTNKALSFGAPKGASPSTIYQIGAQTFYGTNPSNTVGKVAYDTGTYYIQPGGLSARLMVKKSDVRKLQVDKHTMKGRKVVQQ